MPVRTLPQFRIGPSLGQQPNHSRKASVGRAVHGGLAVIVHGVDVRAQFEQQFRGGQRLFFSARLLERSGRAKARGRHQRRGVLDIREKRIGSQFQQHLHQRDIGLVGGEEEGRRALRIELGRLGPAGRQPRVHLGAHRDERPHELQAGKVARPFRGRIAAIVAVLGLAHPSDRVQRGVAGALVVGVGPRFQQGDGQFKVPVLDRQQQRAQAAIGELILRAALPAQGLVHVDARLQERMHDARVAFAHREERRIETGRERPPEIGSGLDQGLDDLLMPFGGGPHERRLVVPFRRVRGGSLGKQRLDSLQAAAPGGDHQDGLAAGQRGVRIRASVEQGPD